MGSTNFGPPGDLVAFLQRTFGISCFVETGTLLGETTAWAAERFENVVTIERAPEFYNLAKARFSDNPRVRPLLGDSREHLQQLAPTLPITLFWLDAHWSGGPTAGENDECPLLDEIAAIAHDLDRHFVLIDDARLFLAPPVPPHKVDHWPTLSQTLDALRTHHRPYIVVHDDAVIAVPEHARAGLIAFLRGEVDGTVRVESTVPAATMPPPAPPAVARANPPHAEWPLASGDPILLVGRVGGGAGARAGLADAVAARLETAATAADVAVGDGRASLMLARRDAAAPALAAPTVKEAFAELARGKLAPGLVVLDADPATLDASLALFGDPPVAPRAVGVVRAASDAPGRWDRRLFDAGYLRVKPGACPLVGDGVDAYVLSAELTDLSLLREPSSNAISMATLGTNGRFANQLFQYAFLWLYGLRNNCAIQTPRWIGNMLYGVPAEPPNPAFTTQQFALFTGVERHLWTMAEPPVNLDFWGYFQEIPASWRRHRAVLRRLFTPKAMLVELIERWLGRTVPADATLVGMHVRRGDYPLFDHKTMPWFRPIPLEWYEAWLAELWPTLKQPVLFIATDDADAVAPHFVAYEPLIAPAHELALPEIGFLPDFYCMQHCAILATVNSSFSRMAALLAEDDQIAYLPNMATERFERYQPWLDEDFWARFEA